MSRPVRSSVASSRRRKPLQSRARQTSRAAQGALVRLLQEKDYIAITIREIVEVAGIGLGTFYEYFSSKDDLARLCLHMYSKDMCECMRTAVDRCAGETLERMLTRVLHDTTRPDVMHASLFLLERQLSGEAAYRDMYQRFVAEWVHALSVAADGPPAALRPRVAVVLHTITHGLFAESMIGTAASADRSAVCCDVRNAVLGYLAITGGAGVLGL